MFSDQKTFSDFIEKVFRLSIHSIMPKAEDFIPFNIDTTKKSFLLALGKSSINMTMAFLEAFEGEIDGFALIPRQYNSKELISKRIIKLEGDHPYTSPSNFENTQKVLKHLSEHNYEQVFCLLSGGGSALFAQADSFFSTGIKTRLIQEFIDHGADIESLNTIRTLLSSVKGGQLIDYLGDAEIINFFMTDVPEDRYDLVASGPTANLINQGTELSFLEDFFNEDQKKYLKEKLSRLQLAKSNTIQNHVIYDAKKIIRNLELFFRDTKYKTLILPECYKLNSSELAKLHTDLLLRVTDKGSHVLITSGEIHSTKSKNKEHRGGRNLDYLLKLYLEIGKRRDFFAFSFDTDGIDGNGDHAGGFISNNKILSQPTSRMINRALVNSASYNVFEELGLLFKSGLTGVNVSDIRLIFFEV